MSPDTTSTQPTPQESASGAPNSTAEPTPLGLPEAPIPRPLDSLDRMRARTKMMVKDYDPATATPNPDPVFRTQFATTQSDGSAQAGAEIQLWASVPMEVEINGVQHSLPDQREGAPTFTTNELGILSVAFSAAGISSPVLHSSSGNLSTFSTLPDFEVIRNLSRLQGAELAPDRAKDYSGQPILLDKYQDPESRSSVADAVRNTIGRSQSNATFSSFLAGQSMASLLDADGNQGLAPNDVRHWTLELGDRATFTPSTSDVLTSALGDAEAQFNIFHDLKDFLNDVVDAGEQVVSAVANWAEDSVSFLVKTLQRAYRFTVRTIQDAVQVVKGIFQAVVQAIEQVIQWLSFLFDWPDIVRTARALEDLVTGKLKVFQSSIDSGLDAAIQSTQDFFEAREQDIQNLISQAGAAHQDSFGASTRGLSPDQAFSGGGEDSSVQVHWLMNRIGATSTPSASTSPQELEAATAAFSQTSFSQTSFSQAFGGAQTQILDRVQTFGQTARSMVEADPATSDIAAQLNKTLEDLGRFAKRFGNLGSASLDELITIFGDLAILAMKAANRVTTAFLQLIKELIGGVIDIFTGELPVKIPFLSELFEFLTGRKLSLVSLGSLLIAVPTTIIYKAIHGRAPVSDSAEPLAALTLGTWVGLAASFAFLLRAVTELVADTGSAGALGLAVNTGVIGIMWALQLFVDGSPDLDTPALILGLVTLFPVALNIGLLDSGDAARKAYQESVGPFIASIYGLLLMMLHLALAGVAQGIYAQTLLSRVVAAVPLASKALVKIKIDGIPIGRGVVLALDLVGFSVAALLARATKTSGLPPLAIAA